MQNNVTQLEFRLVTFLESWEDQEHCVLLRLQIPQQLLEEYSAFCDSLILLVARLLTDINDTITAVYLVRQRSLTTPYYRSLESNL